MTARGRGLVAVKVPARVSILASEMSREGIKTPIGKWEVSPEQLRKTWRGGLLTSGFFVPLQWDKAPGTDKLRVTVRFNTLDGRTFEADKDVTIRPLPGIGPHGLPSPIPTPLSSPATPATPPQPPTIPTPNVPELPFPAPAAQLRLPENPPR